MSEFLRNYYSDIIETPDYICAVGDIPIAICAHLDTVWEDFKGQGKHMYYDKYKECMWCPEGAGFDDKVGIFLVIKIVTSGLKPCIILSCNEEIGCLGASEVANLPCPFSDLKYCIELDRMGTNDCVFYSCDNKDFVNYVESFGFKKNWGSFSDISRICPAWGIAGVNLSVGYLEEHTTNERLYVKAMLRTLSRVKKMLTAEEIPFFEYIPAVTSFPKGIVPRYTRAYDYPLDDDEDDMDYMQAYYDSIASQYYREIVKCDCCGSEHEVDMMFPVKRKDKSIGYRCYNCIGEPDIAWCDYCKEPYEIDPGEVEYVCPECKEMILAYDTGSQTDPV